MLPDNVWDAITIMPKLTELDLLDCVFDSSKMHEILKTLEEEATTNITISSRELSLLSLSAPLLSLLTKLKPTVTNSRPMDDMIIAILKSKAKIEAIKFPKHSYKILSSRRYSRTQRLLIFG